MMSNVYKTKVHDCCLPFEFGFLLYVERAVLLCMFRSWWTWKGCVQQWFLNWKLDKAHILCTDYLAKCPTALLGIKLDFVNWTYYSDNSSQVKCFIPVELVLFELRLNKYIVFKISDLYFQIDPINFLNSVFPLSLALGPLPHSDPGIILHCFRDILNKQLHSRDRSDSWRWMLR